MTMKNNPNHLSQIVSLCLKMDEMAHKIYQNLSGSTNNLELKNFWEHMSAEESLHVNSWKELLKLVDKNMIPQIFNEPENTLLELQHNYNKIISICEQSKRHESRVQHFVLAFRLEFYLLHPALERLWHIYGILHKDQYNPEREYENHIQEFIEAMHTYGANTIELEALGETVSKMWVDAKNMARDSTIDALTSVLNRKGLFNSMTSLAYLSKRNNFNAGLILIDVDHFKRVNDTYGHQAGDEVLIQVAYNIKNNIRVSDIIGRIGGEEFLAFLPQVDEASIFNVAEKIRLAIENATKDKIPVTVSLGGVYSYITGGVEEQLQQLFKQADENLYKAKRSGRNQTIINSKSDA